MDLRTLGSLRSLLSRSQLGKYQASRASPIFEELRSIVEKTAGVPQVIRAALAPLESKIQFAALYGSVAKSSDIATSDIDVLVVSDELALEAGRVLDQAHGKRNRSEYEGDVDLDITLIDAIIRVARARGDRATARETAALDFKRVVTSCEGPVDAK